MPPSPVAVWLGIFPAATHAGGLFVSVTIARAIELKHSSGLVAALANETATLYTDAGVYAGVLSASLYLEDNCSSVFLCTC